jgi:exo-1,4-beta-D-glucosaminidase
MKKTVKKWLAYLAISILIPVTGFSQSGGWKVADEELQNNWQIQSSDKINDDDEKISDQNYHPRNWYSAKIPSSTLGSLVAAGVFKNIFFNRNLENIPDSLFKSPWWYRKVFNVENLHAQQNYRLKLDGISYRADVWLNGKKVASADTLEGSFRQFMINVTPFIKKGKNVLALKVTQAGPGELNIGFVDWNPEPADNNMGIWRNIHLLASGPVAIEKPFIITDVDTATLNHADISLKVTVHNYSDKKVSGNLRATIEKNIHLSKNVQLNPGESKEIIFDANDYPALKINHPRLWWTHDLGKPNLYSLQINYDINGQVSDSKKMKFGIRSVSGYMTKEGFRGYRLNGKKILLKGGGWTDPMLLDATKSYEKAGIDYAVHMNLNTIRLEGFWGNDQHIYNLCDEKGILIIGGFSCQWEWKNLLGMPTDDKYGAISTPHQIEIAVESWRDQVIWLRNHPSVVLWFYGSDKWPMPQLEQRYLNVLAKEDPTRPYVQSAKEWVSEITGPTGMKMRGPYDYVPPSYWYIDTAYGGAFGFNTETGPGPQIPVLESLKKMIPADSLWPIGSSWMYHAARGNFHNLTYYNNAMDARLGKSANLNDYLRKAQYLNYEGMRAMFEAFEANRFKATGIIQWMYNASWPKLWWQLYDYYLMPTGAFYGAKKANEPLHISYSYGNKAVDILNNNFKKTPHASAEINVLNIDAKSVLKKTVSVTDIGSQETREIFKLPSDLNTSKTWFLDLRLFDSQHRLISTNFYVLSTQEDSLDTKKSTWYVTPQSQYADLTLLQQLRKVKLQKSETVTNRNGETAISVKLKNTSSDVAFMVFLDLKKGESNESVVPVFWKENYFTLLPGEERTVAVSCHTADLKGQKAKVVVGGWNVE